jgi:hypothetical protein
MQLTELETTEGALIVGLFVFREKMYDESVTEESDAKVALIAIVYVE